MVRSVVCGRDAAGMLPALRHALHHCQPGSLTGGGACGNSRPLISTTEHRDRAAGRGAPTPLLIPETTTALKKFQLAHTATGSLLCSSGGIFVVASVFFFLFFFCCFYFFFFFLLYAPDLHWSPWLCCFA